MPPLERYRLVTMQEREEQPHIIPFPAEQSAGASLATPTHLGLLAGAGLFPVEFARAARRAGHTVRALGVTDTVCDELPGACDTYRYAPLWRIGKAVRLFHKAGVRRLVMAGRIEKGVLFHPFRWLRLLPDFRSIQMWMRYAKHGRRGNTLLLSVVREFERDGFQFVSAIDYAPELLVKHGFLTSRKPSSAQWRDIQLGWHLAREMGRLDVGQTVVVHDAAVLAVEAIEGTDNCIRRAGELCPRGGFTVIKVAKPDQDMRFNVPGIGIETIKTMHQVGGRVLVVEADMTIMINPKEVAALADKFGIAIVAVNADEVALQAVA